MHTGRGKAQNALGGNHGKKERFGGTIECRDHQSPARLRVCVRKASTLWLRSAVLSNIAHILPQLVRVCFSATHPHKLRALLHEESRAGHVLDDLRCHHHVVLRRARAIGCRAHQILCND
jgi:hypothetical protein